MAMKTLVDSGQEPNVFWDAALGRISPHDGRFEPSKAALILHGFQGHSARHASEKLLLRSVDALLCVASPYELYRHSGPRYWRGFLLPKRLQMQLSRRLAKL